MGDSSTGGTADFDMGSIRLGITFFNEADPNVVMSSTGPDVKAEPPNLLKVRSRQP